MNIKFAFDILNMGRSDQRPGADLRPALSSDKFSGVVKMFLGQKNPNSELNANLDERLPEDILKEEIEDRKPGETKLNLEILQRILSSFKPDLNIICDDRETIQSYKLLLGMFNKHLGDIFLQEDFLTEPVTTIMVPCHSGEMRHFLQDSISGSDSSSDFADLFTTSSNLLYPSVILNDNLGSKTDANEGYPLDVKGEVEDDDDEEEEDEDYDYKPDVRGLKRKKVDRESGDDSRGKTPRKGVGVYTHCDICGKSCVDIKRHKQRKHGIPVVEIVRCDICGEELKSNRVAKHMKDVHGGEGGVSATENTTPIKRELTTVMCPKCGKEVGSKWIDKHRCAEPRPDTVMCPKCGKDFNVKEYRRTQHKFNCLGGGTKQCETCGREFTTNSSYQFHIKTHDANNFMCDKCDYATNTRDYLVKHIQRKHEQRKMKQCPICGKGDIIHLREHMTRVHTSEEDKARCDICGKEFDSKHKLGKHRRKVHKESFKQLSVPNVPVPHFGGVSPAPAVPAHLGFPR